MVDLPYTTYTYMTVELTSFATAPCVPQSQCRARAMDLFLHHHRMQLQYYCSIIFPLLHLAHRIHTHPPDVRTPRTCTYSRCCSGMMEEVPLSVLYCTTYYTTVERGAHKLFREFCCSYTRSRVQKLASTRWEGNT